MNDSSSVQRLRGAILRDVSRSFYLSIRLLPVALRDPIALAYLLARATDTIADTAEIDAAIRLERLQELAALIQAEPPAKISEGLQSFARLQRDEAERGLIERLPECLAWLQAIAEEGRREIRAVLAPINEGQTLDVARFRDPTRIVALEDAAELDRYTYLVAGCVGKFWTDVCFRKLPTFSVTARETMVERGIAYGKGLQLINILRDAGADLRAGRCYLPAEELLAEGLTPDDLLVKADRAEPVLRKWCERAAEGLNAGVEYACAIQPWRVRLATVLPALIGARTLALLREAGPAVFQRRVKIERAEVRAILFRLTARLASPGIIRALARTLSS
ncbi:MAG: phytoene/squalene synthase family protein [Chthoniobacterales bacterium]